MLLGVNSRPQTDKCDNHSLKWANQPRPYISEGMKVWVTLPGNQTKPAKFLAESKESLKWVMEEGDDKYEF